MHKVIAASVTAALLLAGCGEKMPDLPSEPVARAATCGVIEAASERETAGVKGDLSADAQARILHYAMLYASEGKSFDKARVNVVSRRMPQLFDDTIKGKWQALRPTCADAYPPTRIARPALPTDRLESALECYALADFLRKVLSDHGSTYVAAIAGYDRLTGKLDMTMAPAVRAAGLHNGTQLDDRRDEALAAATKRGQPSGLLAACEAKYS